MSRSLLRTAFAVLSIATFCIAQTHDKTEGTAAARGAPKVDVMQTALGDLMTQAGGRLPKSGEEIRRLFDSSCGGKTATFIVPFSGAPKYTDLDEVRKVYMSPAHDLAFAVISRQDGSQDVEFIARSKSDPKRTEFGVIEGFGTKEARPVFVDRNDCITCHKSENLNGYTTPWSNTMMRSEPGGVSNLELHRAVIAHHQDAPKFKSLAAKMDKKEFKEKPAQVFEAKSELLKDPTAYQLDGADVFSKAEHIELGIAKFSDVSFLLSAVQNMEKDSAKVAIRAFVSSVCKPLPREVSEAVGGLMALEGYTLATSKPFLVTPPEFIHLTKKNSQQVFASAEEIEKLHAAKKARRLRNVHPDESPLNEEKFSKDATSLSDGGLSYPIGDNRRENAYRESLCIDPETLAGFCGSKEFNELKKSSKLPTRKDFEVAIEQWKKTKDAENEMLGEAKGCMECHGPKGNNTRFDFDIGSKEAWSKKLGQTEGHAETVELAKKVSGYLRKKTMPPPPYRSDLSPAQSKALQQYLDAMVDIAEQR